MLRLNRPWPIRGWLGLVLIAVCWPLNWMLSGTRTSYLFFPLWLGYVLIVDALVWTRTGTSLWSRSRKRFALLFCLSAPVWWLFELINWRTGNWQYLGRELFSPLEFNLISRVCLQRREFFSFCLSPDSPRWYRCSCGRKFS